MVVGVVLALQVDEFEFQQLFVDPERWRERECRIAAVFHRKNLIFNLLFRFCTLGLLSAPEVINKNYHSSR
jgi:hypothetical protein